MLLALPGAGAHPVEACLVQSKASIPSRQRVATSRDERSGAFDTTTIHNVHNRTLLSFLMIPLFFIRMQKTIHKCPTLEQMIWYLRSPKVAWPNKFGSHTRIYNEGSGSKIPRDTNQQDQSGGLFRENLSDVECWDIVFRIRQQQRHHRGSCLGVWLHLRHNLRTPPSKPLKDFGPMVGQPWFIHRICNLRWNHPDRVSNHKGNAFQESLLGVQLMWFPGPGILSRKWILQCSFEFKWYWRSSEVLKTGFSRTSFRLVRLLWESLYLSFQISGNFFTTCPNMSKLFWRGVLPWRSDGFSNSLSDCFLEMFNVQALYSC